MRIVSFAMILACACAAPVATDSGAPLSWSVWIDPAAPGPVRQSADDVAQYLTAMGREVERQSTTPPPCVAGRGIVIFAGESIAGAAPTDPSDQSFRIAEERCSGGSRVVLSGGGLLGRQYAAYQLLHRWGVRFFHPEEEYVPSAPVWPEQAIAVDHVPAFRWRSTGVHLAHPLELGDVFITGTEAYLPEGRRYIDWTIKNGSSQGFGGVGSGDMATYGLDRGFPLGAGFALYDQQQGSHPIINPDDPRSDEDQIAAAIDERMQPSNGRVPTSFGFTFDPSEFTQVDDQVVVRQLTFIANYIGQHYPGVHVSTINHGTAEPPTPFYHARYFDLPKYAPPNLGVSVHPLMFYDLFRPAPVYGNRNFNFLYDFMAEQQSVRELTYFPEAAWWLTFDIAVPLYLPITIQARDMDMQNIAWMLQGGLDGHNLFGTGHEWGYWQNEYCSLHMAMDLSYRWQDCLRDITAPMGDAGPQVESVMEELIALQERDFFDADMLAYLVGSDPETEVAASVGVVFHPLPRSPATILSWDAARVASWQNERGPALDRMDHDYARLVDRLHAIEPMVATGAVPFFDEIVDGIEASGLRARHGRQVYGALVTLRQARLQGDASLEAMARTMLADAAATTQAALAVIARREQGYRYHPLDRSTAGGMNGTDDNNWTVYHYRYLNRTHTGYYYRRIDDLAQAAFNGGGQAIAINDAILSPAQSLSVMVLDPSFADPSVDWGDGSALETTGPTFSHSYGAVGVYPLHVTGRLGTDAFDLSGAVARVAQEWSTGFSAHIAMPSGIGLVEALLPAVTLGQIDDTRWAIGFGGVADGTIALGEWAPISPNGGTALLTSAPAELQVPVVNHGTGAVSAHLIVHDAVITLSDTIVLRGSLDTAAVVDAVVSIGGFDHAGALRLVASTLGYTPETLPATVDFEVDYTLS